MSHAPDSSSADSASADRRACVSVDIDSLACYRAIHGLATHGLATHAPDDQRAASAAADPVYAVGVRRLLDFLDDLSVPATLFVVGQDTQHPAHRALLAEAAAAGHELGNHSYSHFYDLPDRPARVRRAQIERAGDAIAEVCGVRPRGYRAPGYNITADIVDILADQGYAYDSSIFPCPPYYAAKAAIMAAQWLGGRPSKSAMTPPQNLLAPLGPYRPHPDRIWRRSAASTRPWEIPMALVPGVRFPVIGTSLQLIGKTGFDVIFPLLRSTYRRLFQLEFHAIDFMDAHDDGVAQLVDVQPDLRVDWTTKRDIYTHVIARLRQDFVYSTLVDAVATLDA